MKQKRHYADSLVFCCWALLAMFGGVVGGCVAQTDLIASSYQVTDALCLQLDQPEQRMNYPVVVASFVNIDNLEQSSTFGRAIAEYVGSRFSQNGFKVVELKLRDTVYIKQNSGEFLLSREVKNLSTEHEVKALVVGTYSVAEDTVYVAAKVVDPIDATILATYDYSIRIGKNIAQMLSKR